MQQNWRNSLHVMNFQDVVYVGVSRLLSVDSLCVQRKFSYPVSVCVKYFSVVVTHVQACKLFLGFYGSLLSKPAARCAQ